MGTQTVDKNEITNIGIQYTTDDEIWTINPAVTVSSRDNYAMFSDRDRSTLVNDGSLFSGTFHALGFTGDGAIITNNGNIGALQAAIASNGADVDLTNHGTVRSFAFTAVWFDGSSTFSTLTNDGEIFGRSAGIRDDSSDGATISNSGLIDSDKYGVHVVYIGLDPAKLTTINNGVGGTIAGDIAAIFVERITGSPPGRVVVDNLGTIDGDILIESGSSPRIDVVINKGKILGETFLDLGNDVFNGNGGTSGAVFGEEGDDLLSGGAAADDLNGGPGLDTLTGRLGKDTLRGGGDRDIFDFNSISDSKVGATRDFIADFSRGNNVTGDDIDLSTIDAKTGITGNQAFKFIGKAGFHDAKGELRFTDLGANVLVQGDVNGDGKADFEILVAVGTIGAGDFLL